MQPNNVDVYELRLNVSKDDDDNDDDFINDDKEDYILVDYDDEDVDNPPNEDTNIEN